MKPKVVRTVVNLIEEHHFEVLKVKYPDGSIKQVYLPCDDDNQALLYDEVVSSTHITASLLSYLLFNCYHVNVDETWCRYQNHFGHKKTYMWCLVNKKAGIVIFFYEDCLDELGNKHEGVVVAC